MENYSQDAVKKASKLFIRLIDKSRVRKKDDPELFSTYDDMEVASIMSIFEEEAGIMLLRTADAIYFTPRVDNKIFGFSNEELRSSMKLSNNTELYGAYLIILAIMIKFFNGENYNVKCRTILKVEELEKYLSSKLQTIFERSLGEEEDERLGFNFLGVSKMWMELPSYDEKISRFAASSGTRISLIFKTLGFLKEQGLCNIDNNNEIFTTEKLDCMAMAYYPENSRKKELLSYFDGLLDTNR